MRVPTITDVVRLGTEQITALAALPGAVAQLNRSLAGLAQSIARLDTLVRRLDRLTEPLEAPLAALAPRLEALVPLLDADVLADLPAVLDSVRRHGVPALETIDKTQTEVAAIASSLDRLMQVVEDTATRLQELPGVGLVNRLRRTPTPAVEESRGWSG